MKLFPELNKRYTQEHKSAREAQRLAHEIAAAPVVFQVSRLMLKYGILQLLRDEENGLTIDEIAQSTGLSLYAVRILVESSLTIGTVLVNDDRFLLSKVGWFLLTDEMVRVNLNFNHDVNYLGLFELDKALEQGRPEGLKVFGTWSTIYEGLSQLPKQVQQSWFEFDHYYSDEAFAQALPIVFAHQPKTLLDIGGNTGKWALQCVRYDADVQITIADLPQQLKMMQQQTASQLGAERIHGFGCNLLDTQQQLPQGFDAIWMSQFLDCFSLAEIVSILQRVAAVMTPTTHLYIMETLWDRQRYETAAFDLTQISVYFTALANGNSKMYHSEELLNCINAVGLNVIHMHDGLGRGHTIIECIKQ